MPGADLPLMVEAARRAGEIGRGFFRKSPQAWEKSPELGPVTEADLAVDLMLRQTLLSARPDYGWLSEETEDDAVRRDKRRVFVIDPIDGTRAFIAGEPTWAHALAVVEDGRPVSAVVYLPMPDLMYTAELGQGAQLNGAAMQSSGRTALAGAKVLANRWNWKPEFWPGGMPEVDRHFRPSLAWRLALVGEGRFDAMITLRPAWEWDIAAGVLIAAEAGATVTDRAGHPPVFNAAHPQTDGLVAAPPPLHAELLARLRPDEG